MARENLTICFSGGGFRAMLFHLGVVRALRDLGLLTDITHIFSVSGGSILAAHLVLNWERYSAKEEDTFTACASELIKFAQRDVRGRILRRWLTLGWLPRFNRTRQLTRHYDVLFKRAMLNSLAAQRRPLLHIMATNMVSGEAYFFDARGITRIEENKALPPIPAAALRVADAVAASSAFPPMFPPLKLTAKRLGATSAGGLGVLRFTDGGVFDNTGVRGALTVVANGPLLISDASAGFDKATDHSFWSVVGRTIRTTDILMSRVASLEEQQFTRDQDQTSNAGRRWVAGNIADFVKSPELVNVSPPLALQPQAFQEWIKNVRTDLDVFPDDAIRAIYRHGYEVGLRMITTLRPGRKFLVTEPYWDPLSTRTANARRLHSIVAYLRGKLEGVDAGAPEAIDTRALDAVKRSASRRLGLWNARDWMCWAFIGLVGGFLFKSIYWGQLHPEAEFARPWHVVDVGSAGVRALKQKLEEAGLWPIVTELSKEAHAYRQQKGLTRPVSALIVHSSPLTRATQRLRLCSTVQEPEYKAFTSAVLLIDEAGATYGRLVNLERLSSNILRLDVPDAPKGSILALIVAAVGEAAGADSARLTPSLTEWRTCDDIGK